MAKSVDQPELSSQERAFWSRSPNRGGFAFIAPDIPDEKLRRFLKALPNEMAEGLGEPHVLFLETGAGLGKTGLLVTNSSLITNGEARWGGRRRASRFTLREIRSIQLRVRFPWVLGSSLMVNGEATLVLYNLPRSMAERLDEYASSDSLRRSLLEHAERPLDERPNTRLPASDEVVSPSIEPLVAHEQVAPAVGSPRAASMLQEGPVGKTAPTSKTEASREATAVPETKIVRSLVVCFIASVLLYQNGLLPALAGGLFLVSALGLPAVVTWRLTRRFTEFSRIGAAVAGTVVGFVLLFALHDFMTDGLPMASGTAKAAITQRLKAPDTADFSNEKILASHGRQHIVFLSVDAQNSFGARIRSSFCVGINEAAADPVVVECDESPTARALQVRLLRTSMGWPAID